MSTDDTLLDRAIRVLDYVVQQDEPAGFTELLEQFGLVRSTLAKILRILCNHEMLEKTADGYRIGSRPLLYAGANTTTQDLIARARPQLERLATAHGVTAMLFRIFPEYSVCLDKVMHENAPAMIPIGRVIQARSLHPWHQCLDRLDPDFDVDQYLSTLRQDARDASYVRKQPTQKQLHTMLAAAANGVGDDHGLFIPHCRRLAVLIPNRSGHPPQAALAVGMFAGDELDVEKLANELKQAADIVGGP